eukprot:485239-Rhodomonas_salina.1
MSGIEINYAATQIVVLSSGMVLRYLRYWAMICRYAMWDTEIGYGATPRNQIQENAILIQFVLGMRFLVFDFGVYQAAECAGHDCLCGTCTLPLALAIVAPPQKKKIDEFGLQGKKSNRRNHCDSALATIGV